MSRRVRKHLQRVFRHLLQRVGRARRQRIADARLHVAPPAVIGTGEAHYMGAARVIAGELHRLHHGLGAGHVEGHLVLPGNLPQALDVVGDDGMIGTQHRTEVAHPVHAAIDTLLVEIVSEQVDAVGTGQVVEDVAVEVIEGHARGGFDQRSGRQGLTHDPAVLKRHAIRVGQLKVGGTFAHLRGQRTRSRELFPVERGKALKGIAPQSGDALRRVVRPEEAMFVVFVERDQRRNASCQPRVPGQGSMLGLRQFEPLHEPGEQQKRCRHATSIGGERLQLHGNSVNSAGNGLRR